MVGCLVGSMVGTNVVGVAVVGVAVVGVNVGVAVVGVAVVGVGVTTVCPLVTAVPAIESGSAAEGSGLPIERIALGDVPAITSSAHSSTFDIPKGKGRPLRTKWDEKTRLCLFVVFLLWGRPRRLASAQGQCHGGGDRDEGLVELVRRQRSDDPGSSSGSDSGQNAAASYKFRRLPSMPHFVLSSSRRPELGPSGGAAVLSSARRPALGPSGEAAGKDFTVVCGGCLPTRRVPGNSAVPKFEHLPLC
jgi:hypothetical protein